MNQDDFIEVYENALSRETCTALIQRFEASAEALRGRTGGGIDVSHKNSWDISLSGKPQWADAEQSLNAAMLSGLLQYVRKYAYAILAPHWLNLVDPATGALQTTPTCVAQTGIEWRNCCPAAANAPAGVRCRRFNIIP